MYKIILVFLFINTFVFSQTHCITENYEKYRLQLLEYEKQIKNLKNDINEISDVFDKREIIDNKKRKQLLIVKKIKTSKDTANNIILNSIAQNKLLDINNALEKRTENVLNKDNIYYTQIKEAA